MYMYSKYSEEEGEGGGGFHRTISFTDLLVDCNFSTVSQCNEPYENLLIRHNVMTQQEISEE